MLLQAPETPHTWWWLFPLLNLLGGVAGGIVGGFLSKRGEIAAIQSQIGTVLSQNERIVESTERIKRQLTEETWAKQ
jgi:hypothetical protein